MKTKERSNPMKEEKITINEQGMVIFPADGIVWMAEYEIARLFDVFYSAVGANIRAIFKSGILRKEDVCKEVETATDGYLALYNLEMITALAFRIRSYRTEIFRKWLTRKLTKAEIPDMLIIPVQNPVLN